MTSQQFQLVAQTFKTSSYLSDRIHDAEVIFWFPYGMSWALVSTHAERICFDQQSTKLMLFQDF